jgi:RNA polymerase sigma-70 factor (ECF subfamily)
MDENMAHTEKALMERARAFDLTSLGEIYDTYSPGVYRYAMRLLGDVSLAEDCVAETFSRFLKAMQSGGGPQDHLQAYLYRIAHNWITDHYRRKPIHLPLEEDLRSTDEDTAQAAAQSIRKQEVRAALQKLTADQRQVVVLRFIEGWETEVIARAMDKPVGAIKALQHRGLSALRRLLLPAEEREYELD